LTSEVVVLGGLERTSVDESLADDLTDGVGDAAGRCPRSGARRTDKGVSLVEVLVSIVLLGTAVVAMLAAVRVSVVGSRVERDHSKAHQWLQSSVGIIKDVNFEECFDPTPVNKALIMSTYQASIDSFAGKPDGFDGSINITDLDVWDGSNSQWIDFTAQSVCLDDRLLRQQRVRVEARTSRGDIIEVLEVVKRDEL
jgi:hypothetical protein